MKNRISKGIGLTPVAEPVIARGGGMRSQLDFGRSIAVLVMAMAIVGAAIAPGNAAILGRAAIVVDVQGDTSSSTYCLESTPVDMTYDVFGTPVNEATDIGTVVCTGTTVGGVSSGSCATYPNAGVLSYDTSGANVCSTPDCLGSVSVVSETTTNAVGSLATTLGDLLFVPDTYDAFDSFVTGSSVPNCPLNAGQPSAHYTGTVTTNAFQKVATSAGSNVTVSSATTVYNPLTASEVALDVNVTFAQVTVSGNTVVSASSNSAIPLPANYSADVGGYKPLFIDAATTASVSGTITVCATYADADSDGVVDGTSVHETDLSLMHSEGGGSPAFVERTSSRDVANNVICAEVTDLSTFVVAVRTNGSCAPADEGQPCNDGNSCTLNDTCVSGVCTGTSCDDGNVCTDDTCSVLTGCVFTPRSGSCDDGLFCDGTDTCSAGTCVHSGDPCAGGGECDDACNEAAADCAVDAGTSCTDDGNVCTDDQCDGNGACAHPDNTAPCDDGDSCTASGVCGGGSCQPGTPIEVCGDSQACGTEQCDDGNATDGDGCDSNCTITACGNGVRTGGEECDDGNLVDGDGCESNCTRTPGQLDSTFGAGGVAFVPFGAVSSGRQVVRIQNDGRIIVAGTAEHAGRNDFALARYTPGGSLDTSFDGDGVVITPIGVESTVWDMTIDNSGKIVVSGSSSNGSRTDFTLARYNTDGSLDPSLDGDGILTTSFGTSSTARAVAVQGNGKIFAVGDAGADVIAAARYNDDGSIDTSFAGGLRWRSLARAYSMRSRFSRMEGWSPPEPQPSPTSLRRDWTTAVGSIPASTATALPGPRSAPATTVRPWRCSLTAGSSSLGTPTAVRPPTTLPWCDSPVMAASIPASAPTALSRPPSP